MRGSKSGDSEADAEEKEEETARQLMELATVEQLNSAGNNPNWRTGTRARQEALLAGLNQLRPNGGAIITSARVGRASGLGGCDLAARSSHQTGAENTFYKFD